MRSSIGAGNMSRTRQLKTTGTELGKIPAVLNQFTTAVQLLEDFWQEVKRVMNEKGLPHDL